MKKVLSLFFCILYIDSISHASPDIQITPRKITGEKVLVKAFAAMVNREKNKRTPARKIQPPPSEELCF